jgi:hypothetical protein
MNTKNQMREMMAAYNTDNTLEEGVAQMSLPQNVSKMTMAEVIRWVQKNKTA